MARGTFEFGKNAAKRFAPGAANAIDAVDAVTSVAMSPQKSFMWELTFTDPYKKRTLGGTVGKDMVYHAKSVGLPPRTQEVIKRYYMGIEYTHTSRDTSPRIFRATFHDNQALDAYRFFYNWFEACQYGNTKQKALPITYYRDIILTLKDSTNIFDTEVFTYKDCYPTEITEASLTYSESSELTFDVMFHFSRQYMEQ